MLSTTIKITKKLKMELDKLQAKITLKTGIKLSQQELLNRIFSFTSQKEDEFFQNQILDWIPSSEDEWNEIVSSITDFGIVTKEEDIDQELYGK